MWPYDARPIEHCVVNVHAAVAWFWDICEHHPYRIIRIIPLPILCAKWRSKMVKL